MTLEDKIGQLLAASLDGPVLDAPAKSFLAENHIGNIVHFGNNAIDREQTHAFNEALQEHIRAYCGVPALICIDHEGGRVMRFRDGITWFPSAMALGAAGDEALAEAVGRAMGEELRSIGFHINFAPVLDVNTNPGNPVIGARSFGDDPEAVARLGLAMIRGMRAGGLMACGKHFPGHGDTATDSHYGLPLVDKSMESLWREELYPFAQAVLQGIPAIMTSHILYPAIEPAEIPATMSEKILMGLLRERLGFEGLIISDGMHMQAITEHFGIERGCVAAIGAGVDLLCVGSGGPGFMDSQVRCYRALLNAARDGVLPMQRIDDAVSRILRFKQACGAPGPAAVDWAGHKALAGRVAEAAVTLIRGGDSPVTGRLICACEPVAELRFGVAEGDPRMLSFAEMASQALGCPSVRLRENTCDVMWDEVDAVIVGMGRVRPDSASMALLREAIRRGKRAVAVLTGAPYGAGELPEGCDVWCLYGLTWDMVAAACAAMLGKPASGRLPVRL